MLKVRLFFLEIPSKRNKHRQRMDGQVKKNVIGNMRKFEYLPVALHLKTFKSRILVLIGVLNHLLNSIFNRFFFVCMFASLLSSNIKELQMLNKSTF